MKLSKSVIASLVIAGAIFSGTAAAAAPDLSDLTSSTNVNVTVKDGVATLFGTVDSAQEKHLIASAAAKIDGVDSVRNLVVFTN